MPILDRERDAPDAVLQRSAQQDPWVMYLVVRQDAPAPPRAILLAGARATMRCVEAHADSPAWREAFEAWAARSFRKVSLRAKGKAWERVSGYDGGTGAAGGVDLVRALPPRLRSACDSFLRNLQVYNPDPASLPADTPEGVVGDEADDAAMTFVLNPNATMSLGKQVAQVSHAVLMCAWSPWAEDPRYREAFAAWRARGYPCRIAPGEHWARARARGDGVVVRDAGLTEVAPGTETVLALPPGYGEIA